MKKLLFYIVISCASATGFLQAQTKPVSEQMTETVMRLWPDSMALKPGQRAKWIYDQGLVLKAVEKVWLRTGNGNYFNYIKKGMDFFVDKDGHIRTYKKDDFNIDNITPGRNLLLLYDVLEDERYRKAATTLRSQLQEHPRTKEGGFWHKKVYPWQMWLDGLYMGEPFYAEYAQRFNEPDAFNDIANQFIWMEKHARDSATGLLYHAWDESREQAWANKTTGRSPNFWGSAMGWYGMALVDVLEIFPADHPRRKELLNILSRYVKAVKSVQDPAKKLWWQVLNQPGKKGNYLEASASSMFVYAMAKAIRLGWLPASELNYIKSTYNALLKEFVSYEQGQINLNQVCQVAGLGGNPYRDGSYEYYISEPIVTNDPKGIGAFIQAAVEVEILSDPKPGNGKQVLLDRYFNREYRKNKMGLEIPYHYIWEDRMNSGFASWGSIFKDQGASIRTLDTAPGQNELSKAGVYIIVDPDTEKETANPHFIQQRDISNIEAWVKKGGVLVIMANDLNNVELDHFNMLASVFGIQFNKDNKNQVTGTAYDMGAITIPSGNPVFPRSKKIFVKEYASLKLSGKAVPLVSHQGDIVMATVNHGKGKVFAIGDPWLYNEYVDGRRLPLSFDNYLAAQELSTWLLKAALRTK